METWSGAGDNAAITRFDGLYRASAPPAAMGGCREVRHQPEELMPRFTLRQQSNARRRIGLVILLSARGIDEPAGPTSRAVAWNCATVVTPQAPQANDPPNVQRLGIALTCQSATLGNFTGTANQVVTFTNPQTGAFSLAADAAYTLGDGTLVTRVTGAGTAIGPAVTFAGEEAAQSGTGRFARVSGTVPYTGSASLATGTGQISANGTLTY